MGYSIDEAIVRVDFFKPSGKWGYTEAIKWTGGYKDCCIHEAFKRSLRAALGEHLQGMTAVCLKPHHEQAHPLLMENWQ